MVVTVVLINLVVLGEDLVVVLEPMQLILGVDLVVGTQVVGHLTMEMVILVEVVVLII